MIKKTISELAGNTPLFELRNIEAHFGLQARVLAKLEYFNPAGSVKDRIACAMIDDAMAKKRITKTTTIIEPTSGNTGIGLASVCAHYGMRIILTMPETMSVERRKLLKAYGAEIVLTPGALGMQGALDKANELANEIENSFIPSQFENPVNPETHFKKTAHEIWRDTKGDIAAFVAGVGSGGTISGVGKFLKSKSAKTNAIQIFAVEPQSSPLLSEGKTGAHAIQGIGANFIPATFDKSVVDAILPISNESAFLCARECAKREGILIGISSGAALAASIRVAKKKEMRGKTVVTLFPDSGERYLSTELFS